MRFFSLEVWIFLRIVLIIIEKSEFFCLIQLLSPSLSMNLLKIGNLQHSLFLRKEEDKQFFYFYDMSPYGNSLRC